MSRSTRIGGATRRPHRKNAQSTRQRPSHLLRSGHRIVPRCGWPVEVYEGALGCVVIRQQADPGLYSDDLAIILSPDRAVRVVKAMLMVAGQAANGVKPGAQTASRVEDISLMERVL